MILNAVSRRKKRPRHQPVANFQVFPQYHRNTHVWSPLAFTLSECPNVRVWLLSRPDSRRATSGSLQTQACLSRTTILTMARATITTLWASSSNGLDGAVWQIEWTLWVLSLEAARSGSNHTLTKNRRRVPTSSWTSWRLLRTGKAWALRKRLRKFKCKSYNLTQNLLGCTWLLTYVFRSAYPDAYAKWESLATKVCDAAF